MAFLKEKAEWAEGIRQFELDDVVQGGPEGVDNIAPTQLANRTVWLKEKLEVAEENVEKITETVNQGKKQYAPIESPLFTGIPKAPTPDQFDVTPKLATTEFVQRALGNWAGHVNYLTAKTLTKEDCGKIVVASANVVLPKASSVVAGTRMMIIATSSNVAITPGAGDTLGAGGTGETFSSFILKNPQSFVIVQRLQTDTGWIIFEGDAALKYSPEFRASSSHTGWQKLPSGLIIQWGHGQFTAQPGNIQIITLPIAFPNNNFISMAFNESATGAGGTAAPPVVSAHSYTKTQISIQQHMNVAYTTYFSFLTIGN